MISTYVIFEDQGVANRCSFVGSTVVAAKQRLRETLNIPYFADPIVNGEIVPLRYILRDGDQLQFQKRFGIKGGDERPFEEREAEGLIQAYGLAEIASAVKRQNLPKDESIDLMAVMVGQWANRNFGPPDPQCQKILTVILKHLQAKESREKPVAEEPRLNEMEETILEALGDKRLTGEQLAKEAGYPCNSNFKAALASLVRRKILVNDRPGYRRL